jgi:hypothetical protein
MNEGSDFDQRRAPYLRPIFLLFLHLSHVLFLLPLTLILSSRAIASFSKDCAHGMGFANCITTDESSREGSIGIVDNAFNSNSTLTSVRSFAGGREGCKYTRASIPCEQPLENGKPLWMTAIMGKPPCHCLQERLLHYQTTTPMEWFFANWITTDKQ